MSRPSGRRRHVIRRVWEAAISDRISVVAAGCAFYGLMALFPGISLLVLGYGLVFDPVTVEPQLGLLRGLIPEDTHALVAERVHALVTAPRPRLESGALISLGIVAWSATAGTRAVMSALTLAHGEPERRNAVQFYLTGFALTLGILFAVGATIALLVALPLVLDLLALLGLAPERTLLINGSALALSLLVTQLGIAVLYRFGPSPRGLRFRPFTPGSLLATALWAAASVGFTWYVRSFAAYDSMYGPLGTPVVLLLWFYIAGFAILLGAELDVALENIRRRPPDPARPAEATSAEPVRSPGE